MCIRDRRDVAPGEAVLFDLDGQIHTRQCAEQPVNSPCIFEFVYLARPDSIIDQVSVHKARLRMGEYLAEKILRIWPEQDIDVVIPIPDTSRTAALQMASILGLKYREGFIKNRYIARTFIMPGPVSYTHLDVYKRQVRRWCRARWNRLPAARSCREIPDRWG